MNDQDMTTLLNRVADALERLAPPAVNDKPLAPATGYVWHSASGSCQPVSHISHMPLGILRGIDNQIDKLYNNTKAFADGKLANNALLWGARGTGKSSVIKAVHGALQDEGYDIAIVEIAREDIA